MTFLAPPGAVHRGHRSGWLRAAVLGAIDGLVSTSGLTVGVATARSAQGSKGDLDLLIVAVAGLVAVGVLAAVEGAALLGHLVGVAGV